MITKILLVVTIIFQTIATIYALRLIRTTKYNSIWILFILGFTVLSVERYLQMMMINGVEFSKSLFVWTGVVASVGMSIGVMYAHKLFIYIARLNRQRQMVSRRILSAVLRTEEKSRSQISKELHDGLGPLLSSAKMSLSALSSGRVSDKERAEILENTSYVIDEAVRTLREISNNLSPHVLSDFGLNRAVHNFIKRNTSSKKIKINFESNIKANRYDTDVEVILYRVVCELINNSMKHAKCSEIHLSISQSGSQLLVNYGDNGCGFNPLAVIDCGMGLSNISSRINSLGGTFEIKSSRGHGMSAVIKVMVEGVGQPDGIGDAKLR